MVPCERVWAGNVFALPFLMNARSHSETLLLWCPPRQVSLRQIAQIVLDGALRLPGELLHAHLRVAPLDLASFHFYSPQNIAAGVVALLQTEASDVKVTTNPDERYAAQRFLLYLNLHTWNDDALRSEVDAALTNEMPLLLVHEQRSGHGAVPFGAIMERTPPALLERGIFKSLAVPLYDGEEHQRVCLRVMVGAPDPPSKPRSLWKWPLLRRLQIKVDGNLPALLEMSGEEMKSRASAKV